MSEKTALEQMQDIAKQSMLNSIVLQTKPKGEEKQSLLSGLFKRNAPANSIGFSKIGGQPDLPGNIPWPKWEDRSLSFIAQINLAETKKYDSENLLPADGILYFFYDQDQKTWGFDPDDKGSWSVLYYDGDPKNLVQSVYPEDLEVGARFKECYLEFSVHLSLPDCNSVLFEDIAAEIKFSNEYFDWRNDMEENDSQIINKLLGHPDQIQGDMQAECQLAANGLYCGDSSGYKDPRAEELRKGAGEWVLLLQIDSDDSAGMMWGDVGRLYYWIKKDDLRHKRFENTWMILQCG